MIEFITILMLLFWGMWRELTCVNYRNNSLFKLLFVLLWLYAGLRYRVGTDTFMYMELFNFFPSIDKLNIYSLSEYKIEPLWIIYNSLLKFFCDDFIIVQLTSSLIFNLAVFKFIRNNSTYVFTSLSIYFVIDYLLMNFEFMRQTTALGVYYLLVHKYLEDKKYKLWVVGTILCGFIHNTIFFCFLFPFMKKISISTKRLFVIVGCCLFVVLSNQLFSFLSYIVPEDMSAVEKIIAYRDNISTVFNLNYFIVKFYMFFIVLFCLLFDRHNKFAGIMVLYLIVLALTATHDIFDRLHYCLCLYYFVFFTDVIVKLLEKRTKALSVVLICIISVPNIIYFSHRYSGNVYVYQKVFPYYSYLNPKKSPTREKMQNGSEQFNFIFR